MLLLRWFLGFLGIAFLVVFWAISGWLYLCVWVLVSVVLGVVAPVLPACVA